MLTRTICFLSFVLVVSLSVADARSSFGVNGGVDCAACTVVVGLVEQLSTLYNETVVSSLERLCSFFPSDYQIYCKVAVEFLGPIIIDGFSKGENPDVICHATKLCYDDPGQLKCRAYPTRSNVAFAERASKLRQHHPLLNTLLSEPKICQIPGINEICQIIENAFHHQLPIVDVDQDKFGTESTLRGSSWRGKDCNDFDSRIHPGARNVEGDANFDHNCNGVFGRNSATGRPWEEELCNDTQRLGIAVLGDSISAHFHIPEQWLDARQLSPAAFEHLSFILENALDWPQMSFTTGHVNVSWPNIVGPTRSLYARLFDLDHCNHRDYQNVAVNGADSGTMVNIMKALARDPKNDTPMLVVYSLVGNDVCNGFPDTFNHMTTVDQMYKHVLTTLTYLDTVLPPGSHVLTTGLGNGSLLYALLHDRIHPFGRVGPPVTYPQMYDYLSCLQISPCNGWLTSNDTLRAMTTEHALELSGAVQKASLAYKATHYDIAYIDFPFDEVIQRWINQGGEPWQLIESVDGFHINQYGNALVSDVLWAWLQKEKPQWLPPGNPHNADIERVFKDQGGY